MTDSRDLSRALSELADANPAPSSVSSPTDEVLLMSILDDAKVVSLDSRRSPVKRWWPAGALAGVAAGVAAVVFLGGGAATVATGPVLTGSMGSESGDTATPQLNSGGYMLPYRSFVYSMMPNVDSSGGTRTAYKLSEASSSQKASLAVALGLNSKANDLGYATVFSSDGSVPSGMGSGSSGSSTDGYIPPGVPVPASSGSASPVAPDSPVPAPSVPSPEIPVVTTTSVPSTAPLPSTAFYKMLTVSNDSVSSFNYFDSNASFGCADAGTKSVSSPTPLPPYNGSKTAKPVPSSTTTSSPSPIPPSAGCEAPRGVPSIQDATDLALKMTSSLGWTAVKVSNASESPGVVSVDVIRVIDGLKSPVVMSLSWGEDGALVSAWGQLASVGTQVQYPCLSAASALPRLSDPKWATSGRVYALGAPVPAAGLAEAQGTSSDSPGAISSPSSIPSSVSTSGPETPVEPSSPPAPTDSGLSPEPVPSLSPSDVSTASPASPPSSSLPPTPSSSFSSPAPISVIFDKVSPTWVLFNASDGSAWFLPGYEYTATAPLVQNPGDVDGSRGYGSWQVVSVEDGFVKPGPVAVPLMK